MARRRLGRWVDLVFALVLGAVILGVLVLIRRASGGAMAIPNVPLSQAPRSVVLSLGSKNALVLPGGGKFEVLGITCAGEVWGMDGTLMNPAAAKEFFDLMKRIHVTIGPSSLYVAVRHPGSRGPLNYEISGGMAGSGGSQSLAESGSNYVVFDAMNPVRSDPGRIGYSFAATGAKWVHLATMGEEDGTENGIRWSHFGPPSGVLWPAKGPRFGNTFMLEVPERLSSYCLQMEPDRVVRTRSESLDPKLGNLVPIEWPPASGMRRVGIMPDHDDAKRGFYWHLYGIPLVHVELFPIPLEPRR